MNSRRKLVVGLGAAVVQAPWLAHAQQAGKVWRVGFVGFQSRPPALESHVFGGFPRGMRELGYVEGRNLAIEWRFADGKPERLPELLAQLVQSKADVIVVSASTVALAAQQAATSIPIVFAAVNDPVSLGLVKSLGRPGGNITGRANITDDLGPKRMELLLGMVPKATRIAVLVDSSGAAKGLRGDNLEVAAQKRRVKLLRVEAGTPQEIEHAFATMAREKVGALVVLFTPLFNQQRNQIAELAAKHRLPTVAGDHFFVEAGCLMSYGASLTDDFYRLATYVDKIFKGAKPSDLPVEQPTRFELIINARTAALLGLKVTAELLLQADKVIE